MGRRNEERSLQETLRRRLESCKSSYSTADEIVNHLHSAYPDYHRTKHQALTRLVHQALQSHAKHAPKDIPTPRHHDDDDNDEEGGGRGASRKRRKRIDEGEERLQKMEALHLRRMMHGEEAQGSPSTSSSASSGALESGEEDDVVSLSTSKDAICGEKFEPVVDLMKMMLRNSYTPTKDNVKKKPVVEEKNVELEVANSSKATNVASVVNGGGEGGGGEAKSARKQVNSKGSVSNGRGGGGYVEMKRKEGPRFRDLGGMREVLEELLMEVIVPLYHPQLPRELGVRPTAGILLHGPPGCGKTKLAHAIANETGLPFYQISATEVVSGVSGAFEENIRELFSKAYRAAPSIVFIDEIYAIASKIENLQREMEKRIVTQLMTCMDQSSRLMQPANDSVSSDVCPGYVLVIGATNRPDTIDPALRRPGRFDREIVIGIPDESSREEILSVLTRNLKLEGSVDLKKIGRSMPGFVGADLEALVNEAGYLAMKRINRGRKWELSQDLTREHPEDWWMEPWLPEEMDKLAIKMSDFEEFGADLETGILLYGPPGCGKTLIAKAVANEAGANFIHIKGPEILNKYVGESELAVRTLFSRARTCSPCILFFDEVDSLTTKRRKEGGSVVEGLSNQLLIELDGAKQQQGVFVIAATNRPDVMDRAFLRPGRFGKLLYVPLPNAEERFLILKALARKKPIDATVDLSAIAEACENFSGADLAALMNEAALAAVEEKLTSGEATSDTSTCKPKDFEKALRKVSPSVSLEENQRYQHLSESFKVS